MGPLDHDQIIVFLLSLGTLVAAARILGEVATRLHQPSVLGEIAAGILLGPTVLGHVMPGLSAYLFPPTGPVAAALSGLTSLALVLFLLVAGMEVDLSRALRQGRSATALSVAGMAFPFGLGYLVAVLAPETFGKEPDAQPLVFALFFATALSISAMPVIARTLLDLNLYRSDLGMLIIAAAVLNDLAGWIVFAVILGLLGASGPNLVVTLLSVLAYWVAMLLVGRWLFNRALLWLQAYTAGPSGILALALSVALFCAAFTEWLGVHAIFGSFMVGVAFGDSPHLRQQTRRTLVDFVSYSFAPLFFATIGFHADFGQSFDLKLVLLVIAVACIGKILGCGIGGRLGGLSAREAWAAAAGMNARGAMEIILGLLALRFNLIGQRLFVALVIMALATSMMSGPLMRRILKLSTAHLLLDYVKKKAFMRDPTSSDAKTVLRELCVITAAQVNLPQEEVIAAVLAREELQSSALGGGVAAPHARLSKLLRPVVGIALSKRGLDFDAPDGRPCQVVFLLLTPIVNPTVQLELLRDIARLCAEPEHVRRLSTVSSYTELRGLLRPEATD